MRVLMLSGPNLNLLGRREPDVYGHQSLADVESQVTKWATGMGIELDTAQSNHEGEIIDILQEARVDGVVINPGALTHTSRAIADVIRGIEIPVVEVHISNIREREPWRAVSVLSEVCSTSIYGRGVTGYRDALRHLLNRSAMPFEHVSYGPHGQQVGDLRRGGGDLVVLIHGGIWRHEFGRDTTESLAVDLCNRGFDTWNITYRLLGLGGGWPASGHDVLMALDYIPQLDLESERVLIVGHSAGAYLAIWAAQRSSTDIDLDVALAPLVDLPAAVDDTTPCAPESMTMLDQGAPARLSPGTITTVLVHGEKDTISPIGQSMQMAERHGLELIRSDCGHFELLDPTRPEWASVVERIST
jgi:3-dehydroquinate dehydratase-2